MLEAVKKIFSEDDYSKMVEVFLSFSFPPLKDLIRLRGFRKRQTKNPRGVPSPSFPKCTIVVYRFSLQTFLGSGPPEDPSLLM